MKKLNYLFVLALIFIGCSEDDYNSDTPSEPNPIANAIQLKNDATFGSIITDKDGNSLYFFSQDTKSTSNCSGGCINAWPVFYTETVTLDSGLDAADFGEITREDGAKQTTYKGWPLYFFANDNAAGDTNGDGVGSNWYIAKPDYSLMIAQAQLVGRDAAGNTTNLTSDFTPGDELTFYITDSRGNTLYKFANDTRDNNNFTADDFSNNGVWPIYNTDLNRLPSILNASDFGTIDVFGRTQMTFRGSPLYKFGQDAQRGDNFGVGFPSAGVWPTVNQNTEPAPEPVANAIQLAEDATFGKILTDKDGNSLYFFSQDAKGTSNCSGGCITAWPVFYTEDVTLDSGLDAADFAVITREDGAKQTTYKGWPLYFFANDATAGDTNGDGVGNNWYIAKPDYSLMIAQAQLVGRDAAGNTTNLTSDFTPGDGLTFYITDSRGNTLYKFSNDTRDTNNFTANDFSNNGVWPIYNTELVKLPSILNASDFGTIDVFGRTQMTFKGFPLYKFGQDENRGDNFGVGFPSAGVWPTVNQDTEPAPAAGLSTDTYTGY
ncbi:hypothetical protein D1816_11610 [Aquimarina sp. AD10]|uniref:hypothetical protein n=1 Tax=Aquimarina TaxID=290174 RepID=UPI0008334B9D|nr:MULTISPECIES: hypothetical protein [Aquimarina]AXT60965.1 hypothetical protein D1816_11610 [Aquimarina sp. AD10]RKM95607.1 hypothetical protein D7033_17085 [Aquimarina sp. AD10]